VKREHRALARVGFHHDSTASQQKVERPGPKRHGDHAEMRIVKPQMIVCHGSTAAQTVLGPQARVLRDRGRFTPSVFCEQTFITVHPSSLLRAPDEASREENYRHLVEDLRLVARKLKP
jgi:uracil-DNA glycosylase family 4